MKLIVATSVALLMLAACGGGSSGGAGTGDRYVFVSGPNKTYYFERIAEVHHGNKQDAVGDGHFLTVTARGIYESDEAGNTLNLGFLKKTGVGEQGRVSYEGKAFLGGDLEYVLNSDCSRLNIRVPDGTIYVYTSMEKPDDSSDKLRRYHYDSELPAVDVAPIAFDDVESAPTRASGGTSSGKRQYECPICHGDKRIVDERSINVASYGIAEVVHVTCPECGKSYDKNGTIHRHISCPYCHGRGYQEVD